MQGHQLLTLIHQSTLVKKLKLYLRLKPRGSELQVMAIQFQKRKERDGYSGQYVSRDHGLESHAKWF